MATCTHCSNDLSTGTSCTVEALHMNGRRFSLVRHRRRRGDTNGRCGDCGVRDGGLHHLGCDLQRCPGCGGQLISCWCSWDEFPEREREPDAWDEQAAFDDDADVIPLAPSRPVGPVGPPRGQVPLAVAVAPCRARHHADLASVAEWCLASGRSVDLDIAAMAFELLLNRFGGSESPLRRPDVAHLQQIDVPNWCAIADTRWPASVAFNVWSVLTWMDDVGRIPPGSDPLDALREPLRCYGGLDADGCEQPDGSPRDVDCQCYLPFDPTGPAGMIQRVVSQRHLEPLVALVHPPDPSSLDTFEHAAPLLRLRKRLRSVDYPIDVEVVDWSFAGRTDAVGTTPPLWLYRHEPSARRGYDLLGLDEDGHVFQVTRDRRRKAGYRWKASPDTGVRRAFSY